MIVWSIHSNASSMPFSGQRDNWFNKFAKGDFQSFQRFHPLFCFFSHFAIFKKVTLLCPLLKIGWQKTIIFVHSLTRLFLSVCWRSLWLLVINLVSNFVISNLDEQSTLMFLVGVKPATSQIIMAHQFTFTILHFFNLFNNILSTYSPCLAHHLICPTYKSDSFKHEERSSLDLFKYKERSL